MTLVTERVGTIRSGKDLVQNRFRNGSDLDRHRLTAVPSAAPRGHGPVLGHGVPTPALPRGTGRTRTAQTDRDPDPGIASLSLGITAAGPPLGGLGLVVRTAGDGPDLTAQAEVVGHIDIDLQKFLLHQRLYNFFLL